RRSVRCSSSRRPPPGTGTAPRRPNGSGNRPSEPIHPPIGGPRVRPGPYCVPMGSDVPIAIHVMADSTGDTAARVARATRVQYDDFDTRIVRHPRIRTAAVLRAAFADITAAAENVVVFSTLVDDGLRGLLDDLCAEHRISHVDLL